MRHAPTDIHCILFDLGNTLWYRAEEPVWRELVSAAQAEAVAALRSSPLCPLDLPMSDGAFAVELQKLIEDQINASHRVMPDEEPDFNSITMRALLALGVPRADHRLGAKVYEALRVRSLGSRLLFPDTLSTLAALRARGYALGVVTNRHYGGAPFMDDLRQMGLLSFFDPGHLAISADLKYRKPHPALFQNALNVFGIPAEETAMVGDNLLADVWGAQKLGMFTIWKPKAVLRATNHLHWQDRSAIDGINPAWYTTEEDFLFAWAHQLRCRREPCVRVMAPPNATISQVSDLLNVLPA